MAVTPSYRSFVLEQLGRVVPGLRSRAMFGGVGIYADEHFFALISSDSVYFKVGDGNRGDYEARGMGPFRPFGEHGEVMSYYQLPEDVLEDLEALREWADKAIAVAAQKRRKRTT
ncbi:MAG TPA: TfoX/Sxy family protein [Gemmatimonadaceae bacterium]|nr:TfoX/Sxy family protein [Gemmatimonadaceae bacterium]